MTEFKLAMSTTMVGGEAVSKLPPLVLTSSGIRKNGICSHIKIRQKLTLQVGKQWHTQKSAFRLNTGQKSYAKRIVERKAMETMKAKEREMKDEKEAERQVATLMCQNYLQISKVTS